MEDRSSPPSLEKGKPTILFIELQALEKHSINPLEYFFGNKASWQSKKGRALKHLLIAYHQLIAEEERRINEEMKSKMNKAKQNSKMHRRKGVSSGY